MVANCKQITVHAVPKSTTIGDMPNKTVVNLTRLEELMRGKRWGIGELAEYSGVKYDTVYSLVKGRRPNSNVATLKKIADALDVSADYLLGQSDDKSPPASLLPQPIRHLTEIAAGLSAMRQEELLRIARALAELERERATLTVSMEAMRAVLQASGQFKDDGAIEDLIEALRLPAGNMPARWLIDLRPTHQAADEPAQGK